MFFLPPAVVEALAISLDALARHKLRTSLSVVGIVVGVAAVIAMMAVGEGARLQVLAQVEALGIDNVSIRPRYLTGAAAGGRRLGLTVKDSDDLRHLVPGVTAISDFLQRTGTVSGPASEQVITVFGVEPAFADIMQLGVSRGRFLHALDVHDRPRPVAVLGSRLAVQLFGATEAVHQFIRIEREWYEVVGVLRERAVPRTHDDASLPVPEFNDVALVPIPALIGKARPFSGDHRLDAIWLRAESVDHVAGVASVADRALRRLHAGIDDYELVVPRRLMEQRYRMQRTFNIVVGSVAALALLVGGIGIMNIMLASVFERTQEIGLRRTVGATERWIAAQFLVESVLMTTTGGLGGVLAGSGVAWAIQQYARWPISISLGSVVLSVSVAMLVGVGFGLYPAIRASRLQPIEAVRYE